MFSAKCWRYAFIDFIVIPAVDPQAYRVLSVPDITRVALFNGQTIYLIPNIGKCILVWE